MIDAQTKPGLHPLSAAWETMPRFFVSYGESCRYYEKTEGEQARMDMTNEEYKKYVQGMAKPSPSGKNLVWAFCVGGGICTVGQLLSTLYQRAGLDRTDAGTAVSVTLIFAAALCTGLGIFDDLAKHAGAGTLVPITGFANAMVSPALEFKSEGLITGTAAKLFVVAGPVLVYGIFASVVYGLILCLIGV